MVRSKATSLFFAFLYAITCMTVSAKTYYVATNGSDLNNGTSLSTPFATWQRGINVASPGDTIFVRGGVYYIRGYDNGVLIDPQAWPSPKGRSGTAGARIHFWAYPPDYEAGNRPILDCRYMDTRYNTTYGGFGLLNVQYWHIKGITVRNVYQRRTGGILGEGIGSANSANLIYENCTSYNISGRGFSHWSGAWNSWDGPNAPFKSDTTYFINCDAYNICDSLSSNPGNAGDGFKCGNYYRNVLYFIGCRAWNYSDDGIDPSGAGKRIVENCWVMATNKYLRFGIEGNGFKFSALGGDQAPHIPSDYVHVEVRNSMAAYCQGSSDPVHGSGFINNLEWYDGRQNNAIFHNNTSYRCGIGFSDFFQGATTRTSVWANNIAIYPLIPEYQVCISAPYQYTAYTNTWIPSKDWPGWSVNPAFSATDADFVSVDSSQIRWPRKPDGSLPDITFLKLKEGSDLIDAGTNIGLPYYGSKPDIGYSEFIKGAIVTPTPVFVNAVIQNTTPTRLEMNYNMTLANIVPATSVFTVRVNSSARSVTAVAVSGTRVFLTLASPVVYGDVVTVAYTKPATNPLQTPEGGQAASLSTQSVTNNCAAPVNQPPVVSITGPVSGSTFTAPATVTITANATDPDGTVAKVEFYNGTIKLGEKTSSPWSYTWNNVQAGTYSLTAVATDNSGAKTTSSPVSITVNATAPVNQPPVISITSPAGGSIYTAPATVTIATNASDPDGTVAKVEFYNGSIKLGEKTSSPWSYTWNNVQAGTYSLTAVATDNSGAKTTSTPVSITVNPATPGNQPPVISISSPASGSTYTAPATVAISANASDPDGTITKVEFFNGSTKLGERSSAPWSFTWNNVQPGTYQLTAVATDNANTKSTSSAVSITVNDPIPENQPPVVSIASPTKGKRYKKPANIEIHANASDPDGTIIKVEFYSETKKLAELTTAPWVFTWKDVDEGIYYLTAVATDNRNATTTSSPVEIAVEAGTFYDPDSEIFNLYPNPNNGHFTIDFVDPMQTENTRVTITSPDGRAVFNGNIYQEEITKKFDLSFLKPGVYICILTGRDIIVTKKFIKK